MLLSQNQKTFSEFFAVFPQSTSNLQYFETKDESRKLFVSDIIDFEKQSQLNAEKAAHHKTYGESTFERVRNTA